MLINPRKYNRVCQDDISHELCVKTIGFFEERGQAKLRQDDHDRVWYQDFLDFQKKEKLFATFLTPPPYGERFDMHRNGALAEILGFYGLPYWYTWQVTMLGLGPIWMSHNESIKKKAANLLEDGGIFGFGLSEKEHGADLYATEMALSDSGHATGRKYYIGNANKASLLSTFGKQGSEFVFFAVDPSQDGFRCIQNVVNSQNYVGEYELNAMKITDILSRGDEAWDTALNTINICKCNLGWASVGIATHAFYEAIHHAAGRKLYNKPVTDFPHVKGLFIEAYCRLIGMKIFTERAFDVMRSARQNDRRYLLTNPMIKMKVTLEGERVIDALWDIIAAKGFEKSMFFDAATRDIRALPKLEGTVHVNMALVTKFMKNYFSSTVSMPEITPQRSPAHDAYLFTQGPTKGLKDIRFDARPAWNKSPNAAVFEHQVAAFKRFILITHQDNLLKVGDLFSLIVYKDLLIGDSDTLDALYGYLVDDFSHKALALAHMPGIRTLEKLLIWPMIRCPIHDAARDSRIYESILLMRNTYKAIS